MTSRVTRNILFMLYQHYQPINLTGRLTGFLKVDEGLAAMVAAGKLCHNPVRLDSSFLRALQGVYAGSTSFREVTPSALDSSFSRALLGPCRFNLVSRGHSLPSALFCEN